MKNTKDLHELISEIEALTNERTKPDGSFSFDGEKVYIMLETIKRIILTPIGV